MTPWANQCQKIADSFVNRKFKARFRFPKKPTESNVWRWVHRIQAEFIESYKAPTVTPSDKSASSKKEKTFPLRSNKFRTTSAWQFEGSESPRQVDFFFKSRKHAVGTPHDWRDVLVLGELTSSSVGVWKSKFLQLSVYMREVFMAQPLRRFVHGFLLFGTKLQLWISWRAVGRMSEVELLGKSRSIRGVATLIGSLDMEKISELRDGLTFTKAMQREIQPDEEPMTTPHDLLQPETSNQEGIVQPSGGVKRKSASSAGDSQQSKRSCVSSIPRQARTNAAVASMRKGGTSASKRDSRLDTNARHDVLAPGKLTALKNSTPTINQSLNQGSTSSGSKRSRNDGEMNVDAPNVPERELKKLRITSSTGGPLPEASAGPLPASNAADATVLDVPDVVVVDVNASPKISNMSTTESSLFYRDRLQSIIASKPSGRAIGEDTSPLDLLCGLRDAIKGHRSLFLDARILHRDVSVNNIILTDPKTNDDCCGVLIDLDLAMSLDDPNAAASSHILTGTMEFMALGILRANLTRTNAGIKHSYRHDLESFFYVLVSTSMRFGWGDKKATHLGLLGTWYKGTVQSMYNAKFTAIHVDSFESNVLSGFSAKFECLKDVAKKMRASLFDRGCGFWLGEDHHPETLYNPILLDLDSEIAKMECDYA
ncbi:BgTH12-06776 [Blumeria graminis f. sp. triticale]|uniref:non-specific serine/threonine protein kinase n=1 Tax=Blumeria graminis f. sp. triticale TaxID=1689686 RepID=A0A9W4D345_BLUGR|nr:BgTH12-06776 [Blumeria graminis f. sp. triticale]